MPEGIIAEIDEGFATLDFVDRSLRGPALQKLIDIGGPHSIETLTRSGPRRQYRVPEGNAREAGLIDEATESLVRGDTGAAQTLADSASTTGSPAPVTSRNAWGTGRDPITAPASDPVTDPASAPAPEYPEGEPTTDWKFDQLKAYAAAHNVDTDGLRSKVDVLAAINTTPVSAPVEQTADADPAQAVDVADTGDGFDIPVTSDDDDKDAS
ncbi:hypothetical protein SEA_BIGGITYBASS_12 [Gordonia phage BiggityBass]|nr:hypothetical protein SEA_BIGGITYBASS_12 [Gordonia phage BiggityBass]